jgi:trans-AT polyketide synthase/acyltransferase/oxidoreductase domain-containing protein
VIGLRVAQVARVLAESTPGDLVVANDNSDQQVVIAGPREIVSDAKPVFERAGAQHYIPLPVSGAFHSPLMSGTQRAFAGYLGTIPLEDPLIPVIGNVAACPIAPGSMREQLVQQITAPVRWRESIGYLLDQGETEFEERGGGQTLTKLIQQIRAGWKATGSHL